MEAKETYYGGKRDLLWRQKRPAMEAKETCYIEAKETCSLFGERQKEREREREREGGREEEDRGGAEGGRERELKELYNGGFRALEHVFSHTERVLSYRMCSLYTKYVLSRSAGS
jgi:hypothetical protein